MAEPSRIRVLHLEDDPPDAELVAETLADAFDCTIVNVVQREEFADELERGSYDVILADFTLPSFDGMSALAMASKRHPDVPFIFVTGTLGEDTAVESLKSGATDYVLKNRMGRLVPSVRRALEEAADRRQMRETEARLEEYRKRLEAMVKERTIDLQNTNEHLRRQLAENERMQQDLREATRRAEAASTVKSAFLAQMSHELRTPLNAIIGFSEVLTSGHGGALEPKQKEYVDDILQSGRHLLALINELLDLSRIESGKMQLALEDFDVLELVRSNAEVVRQNAAQKRILLHIDAGKGEGIRVHADTKRVSQIILNILSNAIKFTPEGGEVRIAVKAGKTEATVTIRDNGIGIEAKDRDTLFGEFQQVENKITRSVQGSGLGLSLTRKLVELLGGRIWFESPGVNLGTTFFFTLPLARTPSRSVPVS